MIDRLLPNTLSARLFAFTSIAALIGILIVALVISFEYRRNAELRLDDILAANLYNLMGNVEFRNGDSLSGEPNLGDGRYNIPSSGWYWVVKHTQKSSVELSSPSQPTFSIKPEATLPFDDAFQRIFEITDPDGNLLRVLEAQVFLGEADDLFQFAVTVNKSVLETEVVGFLGHLLGILFLFALMLVLAMYFILKIGLRPLKEIEQQIGEIRLGKSESIKGEYPQEVRPLVEETNALIKSNSQIVERARTQVGNLAHSLKTPLAVLNNETQKLSKKHSELFTEQIGAINNQVKLYLDRARISARSATSIARCPIVPNIEKVVAVIEKLNPNIDVELELDALNDMDFAGEEPDLQEVIGNLLENAAKYTKSSIKIYGELKPTRFILHIDDDGNGMSKSEIDLAKKRGGRADEGKVGWGLGLSIVRDIIEEYSGEFDLSQSELGGLRASITLPVVSR